MLRLDLGRGAGIAPLLDELAQSYGSITRSGVAWNCDGNAALRVEKAEIIAAACLRYAPGADCNIAESIEDIAARLQHRSHCHRHWLRVRQNQNHSGAAGALPHAVR